MKKRDYIQEVELAYKEFSFGVDSFEFEYVIVPLDIYNGFTKQLSEIDIEDFPIKFFGRKVFGSPHADKIEFR